jgi:hypothetical protein
MKQKKLPIVAIICAFSMTVAGAVVASRVHNHTPPTLESAVATIRPQEARASGHTPYPYRVLSSVIRPQLHVPLDSLGDRLTKQGKERLTLSGTLSRAGVAQRAQVVSEFPNLLGVNNGAGRLASFDELDAARSVPNASPIDDALVETFFYDTAEHFFFAQARGAATRFLGARVSSDEEAGLNSVSSVYDVYELTEEVAPGGAAQTRAKCYFFNSETQLLEVVRYEIERDGSSISVEARIGGWRKVQGEQVAGSIVRLENDRPVLSFVVNSVTLAPRGGAAKERPARKPV